MKIVFFFVLLSCFLKSVTLAEDTIMAGDDKKDWVLDLKSSQLIPNYAGKVKKLKGKVQSNDEVLSVGDKIYPKNKIKTSDNSFVIMEMIDRSYISLGPKSEMEIVDWQFRNKNDRDGTYYLFSGKLRGLIREKAIKNDQIKFKTPLAALGVRGTEIFISHLPGDKLKALTEVGVLLGKLAVYPYHKTFKKLDLNPSESLIIQESDSLNLEGDSGQFKVNTIDSAFRLKLKTLQEIVEKDEEPWFLSLFSNQPTSDAQSSTAIPQKNHQKEGLNSNKENWKEELKQLNELRKENTK